MVAVAYDAHFTAMYGVAEETASMLFKDQFSLKIETEFWEKNRKCVSGAEKFPYFLSVVKRTSQIRFREFSVPS